MRHHSSVGEMASPFDLHLLDVYAGRADVPDGLAFFEEHGYYDVSDAANTVQMFRENVGLDEFWHERDSEDACEPLANATVYPFGSQSKVTSSRMREELHRTNSGRFTLLDDDGNPVSEDDLLEMEREDRLKVKSLALDADDLAELEHEQASMEAAIEVIRVEKSRFQSVLLQAFFDQDVRAFQVPNVATPERFTEPVYVALPPVPPPVALLEMPPYCGNVFVLRDSIALLRRSWSKRWFVLDFQHSLIRMFKRSYWRSPRGEVGLRMATKVEKMGLGGFRLEFQGGKMLLMRSKDEREAGLWVQLLRFAIQMMHGTSASSFEMSRLTNS
ncbi:hypothetical protein BBJ28_00017236 [Nothophytophthora sp. Chile5]|nr:hypothetical protein BBJ28_00017236 [Nothophytophthora sp. Chile5]